MRDVIAQSPFDGLRGSEEMPGFEYRSGVELSAWVREHLDTQGHPACTCRMGNDEGSVVDDKLSVRGVEGLWIVDASVMPTLTNANTYATTVMIAEKAADILRGIAGPSSDQ
jgi:choline dehydrogenase